MFSNGVYEEMGHRSSSFRRLSEETAFQPVNVMVRSPHSPLALDPPP
jgi:hypothetical protein